MNVLAELILLHIFLPHVRVCCPNLFLFIIFVSAVANNIPLDGSKTGGYVVSPTYLCSEKSLSKRKQWNLKSVS